LFIRCLVTRCKEETAPPFFCADNLPQISYLKLHIAYKFDFDGKTAKELRQKREQHAKDQKWTVLFYHDFSRNSVAF